MSFSSSKSVNSGRAGELPRDCFSVWPGKRQRVLHGAIAVRGPSGVRGHLKIAVLVLRDGPPEALFSKRTSIEMRTNPTAHVMAS